MKEQLVLQSFSVYVDKGVDALRLLQLKEKKYGIPNPLQKHLLVTSKIIYIQISQNVCKYIGVLLHRNFCIFKIAQ